MEDAKCDGDRGRRGAREREKDVNKKVEKEEKKKDEEGNVTTDSVWDAAAGGGRGVREM